MKKLRQELLVTRQYDRMSRPVKNHLTQTKVDMKITINEFVHLDTASSILVTDAWFHISWRDEMLTWDPNDYQQIKQIHVATSEVWRPDIVLINTADHSSLLSLFTDSEILVNSTGDVQWITMGLLYSKCPNWGTDYPYVARPITCKLVFCSLIYQSHEVNITTPGNEFYLAGPWVPNPRLSITNITGERYERAFDGYGKYSFETLIVTLRRYGNAMPMLIRIPTWTAVTMILLMFFMPLNSAVRVHLVIVAMLIQISLMLYIGLQLGPNAIGLARPIAYLRDDLFLASIALAATLIFRRLLVIADNLPQLPYSVSSFLSGPIGRFLCFGVNQNEYALASSSNSQYNQQQQQSASAASNTPFASSSLKSRSHSFLPTSIQPRSSLGDHVSLVNEDTDEDSALGSKSSGGGAGDGSRSMTALDMPSGGANFNNFRANSLYEQQQGLTQVVLLSGGQYEWMQLIVFCDRVMFAYYAIYMLLRLI